MNRREFLRASASLTAGLTLPWLAACGSSASPSGNGAPILRPKGDPLAHLLRRTRFGTRARDFTDAVALGPAAYLESQLVAPQQSDLVYAEAAARFPATLLLPPADSSLALNPEIATQQLAENTVFLACYSDFQLYEVMVDFWTNHFNIENVTGELPLRKLYDESRVIRPHAFGRFRDMLHASSKSPAMLEYLDSMNNVASAPNQNYARELMELHTLGVDGGYTEADMKEVARCFTGWGLNGGMRDFEFHAADHDDGEKRVLGRVIAAGGGVTDGEQVIDLLASHPSTARFIATKLARRFVSDVPPASLVDTLAQAFTASDGDIPTVLRALFTSKEFFEGEDAKYRRPLEYVAGVTRAVYPDTLDYDGARLLNALSRMGQIPHRWFPPDGYPDRTDYWLNTSGLLEYWNFAAETVEDTLNTGGGTIAAHAAGATTTRGLVEQLAQRLVQRPLADADRDLLVGLAGGAAADEPLTDETRESQGILVAGLLLASPYFTVR